MGVSVSVSVSVYVYIYIHIVSVRFPETNMFNVRPDYPPSGIEKAMKLRISSDTQRGLG